MGVTKTDLFTEKQNQLAAMAKHLGIQQGLPSLSICSEPILVLPMILLKNSDWHKPPFLST